MEWRFWRRKTSSDESSTTTVEGDEAAREGAASDAPRLSGFSFSATPPPDEPDAVADVVRAKAAARRGPSRTVRERGITPLLVPSLLPLALNLRARAEELDATPTQAAAAWPAYLALCPDDVDGWFAYGRVLLETGQPEPAWQAFTEVRARAPEHRLALGALGFLSARRQDFASAATYFAAAVQLDPECPDMLMGLAEAQAAAGRRDDARATQARVRALAERDQGEHD